MLPLFKYVAKVRIFSFPPNFCDESSGNLCSVCYRYTEQQGEGILPPLISLESGPRTSARLFLGFWGSNLRLGFSKLWGFLRVERGESGKFSTNLWKGQMVRLWGRIEDRIHYCRDSYIYYIRQSYTAIENFFLHLTKIPWGVFTYCESVFRRPYRKSGQFS